MHKLPLDLSTFSKIRNSHCVYVDKTEHMYNMITNGHRYFLSRPRRFGKSLLVSTLKEILSGNKELFNNLWIGQSNYQWHEYGVIQLDFSGLKADTVEMFKHQLQEELYVIAEHYQLTIPTTDDPGLLLKKIVLALFKKYNRVAILVDEYDSQILKTLHDPEIAKKIRNEVQQFFTTIKSLDEQIQFVFITGVSSFARAGLFSGINNLQIITLQDKYATICGYTDQEVDHYFKKHMANWAEKRNITYDSLRQEIKNWYNGYAFGDNVPKVYNPFSLMNALNIAEFENFWFQSGTPTFLVDILKKESHDFDLDATPKASKDFLGIFDIDYIPTISLMFQAGYLTIIDYNVTTKLYTLDYPNLEVKVSFQKYLLEVFTHIKAPVAEMLSWKLYDALDNNNIEDAVNIVQALFAHIRYQLHSKQEKFYHSLLIMAFICGNIKAQAEYSTSHGRIDLVLDLPNYLYIVEIKFNQSADVALAQIKERRYYERFIINNDKPIILLGLSFNRQPSDFTITYAVDDYIQ